MNRAEAIRLVDRIGGTWSKLSGPKTQAVWAEALEPLDYELAVAAIDRLDSPGAQTPSLPDFRGAYRSLERAVPTPPAGRHAVAGPEYTAAALADCRAILEQARATAAWRQTGWRAQRKDPTR